MNTGFVIFSRMDSSRLPGKALRMLNGKPLIQRVLDRANRLTDGRVVVATSDREIDDEIHSYATEQGIGVFRGSADNVAERAYECAKFFEFDRFVRICGDSPFLNIEAITELLATHAKGGVDVATNTLPRTFPPGGSAEIISTSAMSQVIKSTSEPDDLEHVTRYFYMNPESFNISNLESGVPWYSEIRIAVDTLDDVSQAQWMLGEMGKFPENETFENIAALARKWFENKSGENQ